jgi:hypothetical protein
MGPHVATTTQLRNCGFGINQIRVEMDALILVNLLNGDQKYNITHCFVICEWF